MAKLVSIESKTADVLRYIKGRQDGTITSMKTGFSKLDKAMIDGIEWNSTVTLGGRPSSGKSAVSDCIVEGSFQNNLDHNLEPTHDLLDFNWELSAQVQLIRKLSSRIKKSYKQILSADGIRLSNNDLLQIEKLLKQYYSKMPITFCEEPLTVKDFGDTVRHQVSKTGRKTLVRIDHTLLTRQSSMESQVQMLLNLMMEANTIKKEYPVIFMFLTQLNRDFEDRQEDGTDKAFPRQSDVYGGDASAMFSETIILLNNPMKYGIEMYGKRFPGKKPVQEHDLFLHVVKNRNSVPDLILQYKEDFQNMSIIEQ